MARVIKKQRKTEQDKLIQPEIEKIEQEIRVLIKKQLVGRVEE